MYVYIYIYIYIYMVYYVRTLGLQSCTIVVVMQFKAPIIMSSAQGRPVNSNRETACFIAKLGGAKFMQKFAKSGGRTLREVFKLSYYTIMASVQNQNKISIRNIPVRLYQYL
jgi:hypothetical protein